jgi:hypothetical protein
MRLIVFILSIYVFIKTISYGLFEFKEQNNKASGIIIYVLAVIVLIAPNILIYMR